MGTGRALITGGSVGIGAALAGVFAAHGHNLILVSRNREKLERRAREIQQKFGVQVTCLPEDLTDPAGPRHLHEAVTERSLDVHYLVNNAGVGRRRSITSYSPTASASRRCVRARRSRSSRCARDRSARASSRHS